MTTIAQSSSEAQRIIPFHDGARFVYEGACRKGVVLPPGICHLIAEYLLLPGNIQSIVGEILQAAQDRKQPLTSEFVGEYLQQRRQKKQNYPAPEIVLQSVADYFRITVKELRAHNRHAHLFSARRMASHLLQEMCHLSLTRIATLLERADHTTVIGLLKVFARECDSDPTVLEDLQEVQRMVLQRAGLS